MTQWRRRKDKRGKLIVRLMTKKARGLEIIKRKLMDCGAK